MNADVLIIGGGIAGMTAAIELAEAGCRTVLVEKSPTLGGRVAQMHQYFPKLCPPACGLEINFKRIRNNPAVTVLTLAEVQTLAGGPGDFQVEVEVSPRYVTDACTLCGKCADVCPREPKATYLPSPLAYPPRYAIDWSACLSGCDACAHACAYNAIDLSQEPERLSIRVAAVIAATGWAPYDAARIEDLGFGRCANVVTNLMLEQMAAAGAIRRPSDGKEPRSVVFVQCAGSRDENHLPYCSTACCSASLKQATYIRSRCPDAAVTIFYIDVRTPGMLEEFYARVAGDRALRLVKGKVARVEEDPETRDLLVTAEDVMAGRKATVRVELVVLATGMTPQTSGLPDAFARDEFGFVTNGKTGLYAAGCARRPGDVPASVREATGAALKALQCVKRPATVRERNG